MLLHDIPLQDISIQSQFEYMYSNIVTTKIPTDPFYLPAYHICKRTTNKHK